MTVPPIGIPDQRTVRTGRPAAISRANTPVAEPDGSRSRLTRWTPIVVGIIAAVATVVAALISLMGKPSTPPPTASVESVSDITAADGRHLIEASGRVSGLDPGHQLYVVAQSAGKHLWYVSNPLTFDADGTWHAEIVVDPTDHSPTTIEPVTSPHADDLVNHDGHHVKTSSIPPGDTLGLAQDEQRAPDHSRTTGDRSPTVGPRPVAPPESPTIVPDASRSRDQAAPVHQSSVPTAHPAKPPDDASATRTAPTSAATSASSGP